MHLLKPFHISLKTAFARFFRQFSPILNFIAVTLTWNPKLLSLTAIEQFLCWWFRISIFTINFLKWSLPEKSTIFWYGILTLVETQQLCKEPYYLILVVLFERLQGQSTLWWFNLSIIRFFRPYIFLLRFCWASFSFL